MLHLRRLRVLVPEHIGHTENENHSQQHRSQRRHDAHDDLRANPAGAGTQSVDHNFLSGVDVIVFKIEIGLFLFRQLEKAHEHRLLSE